MQGLMQDYELTIQHILWRLERLLHRKEVVTEREDGLHRITYGQMLPRINRLAGALRRLGVRSGDRVGTLALNGSRHLELYYAVPCMGAVLHTLNMRLFPTDLEFVINDAQDQVIVVDRALVPVLNHLAGKLPAVKHIVVMDTEGGPHPAHQLGELLDYEQLLAAETDSFDWPKLDERMAAAMCYTTGTTGRPKGAVYSHRSQMLHTLTEVQPDALDISERDVVLPIAPMFHANAWGLPYSCGMVGAKLLLLNSFANPKAIVDLIDAEGATEIVVVPTILTGIAQYLEQSGRQLPLLRTVISGGSAVPRSLMERMDRLGLPIVHAWGMTETSPAISVSRVRTWVSPDHVLDHRLSQGPVVPFVEIRIMDPVTNAELPWDGKAFGEAELRGPWIASGYYNNADPGKLTSDGWFRTGDVVKLDPDGNATIVDRGKDMIKSGGEWISSVDLENAIMGHPKVLEAAVVAVPHPRWAERPVAYVVARPEHKEDISASEIQDFLKDKVLKWWLPDEIRFIDALPKTSVGKFDKKLLRANAEPIGTAERAGAPASGSS